MSVEKSVEKGIKNVKDTVHEAGHRGVAEGEKASRETAGDMMTPSEKASSVANQVKHTAQADYDAAKRNVRNNT
jgi:hypothetical protein